MKLEDLFEAYNICEQGLHVTKISHIDTVFMSGKNVRIAPERIYCDIKMFEKS